MKPVACSVEWYEGYANDPQLRILVDKFPEHEKLKYEQKGNLYFAELEGYVSFFYYSKPDEGYAGRHFPITMKNGTEKTLIGPWSSRAGAMSSKFRPVLDVIIQQENDKFPDLWYAGHVTLEFALEAIKLCAENIELVVKDSHEEYIFVPKRIIHPCTG